MEVILHPQAKKHLERYLDNPSHSLIITSAVGTGKVTVALYIAGQLLNLNGDKVLESGKLLHIRPSNGSISIDEVRSAQSFTELKSIGTSTINRIIVFEDAHLMTMEAQNALLKLLEEPPSDTIILLTTTGMHYLTPTILSRSTVLRLHNLDMDTLTRYLGTISEDKARVERAIRISGGRIGKARSIITDESTPYLGDIETAKQIIASTRHQKLNRVDEFSKDKAALANLLDALEAVCDAGLKLASARNDKKQLKLWHRSLSAVLNTQRDLSKQANSKLLLTNLMLNL